MFSRTQFVKVDTSRNSDSGEKWMLALRSIMTTMTTDARVRNDDMQKIESEDDRRRDREGGDEVGFEISEREDQRRA